MAQIEEDTKSKEHWTENDLKEAVRRINAGEINSKEAEDFYGISLRTIHRQRAIENMRAQLNPEKAKKVKTGNTSSTKKDITILRKHIDISCSTINDIVNLLNTGTEEIKQLLNFECDIIYECKVCKNLFRSLVNFISHKRIYCCDLYSVIHSQSDKNEDGSEVNDPIKIEEKLKVQENFKEFAAKPFRITCRKDLTSIIKRISAMSDLMPTEPILHLQSMENSPCAFQQVILTNEVSESANTDPMCSYDISEPKEAFPETDSKDTFVAPEKNCDKPILNDKRSNFIAEKRFRCPVCHSNFTIKKSVMRHLKSVHNKSIDQLERLKSRIQMHFVRIKSNTNENNKQPVDRSELPIIKPNSEQPKSTWMKKCLVCNRHFINRNSYAAHMKVCRKHSSLQIENSEQNILKKPISLVPIISLTPISADDVLDSRVEDKNVNSSSEIIPCEVKKNISTGTSTSSKKLSSPLSAVSSSSQSKKIGIQVRMNYCKENSANQSTTNGGASLSSEMPLFSERASKNISANGKSVITNKQFRTDKIESGSSHNTRSVNKSTSALETLFEKRRFNDISKIKNAYENRISFVNNELDNKSRLADQFDKNDELNYDVKINSEKNEITVYCENCKTMYPLSDFPCSNILDKKLQKFRCTLRNCTFHSNNFTELLPHVSEKHAVLLEKELSEVKSIFVAESLTNNEFNLCFCNKKSAEVSESNNFVNDSKTQAVSKKDFHYISSANNNMLVNEKKFSQKTNTLNASNKRKLNLQPNKSLLVKRKIVKEKKKKLKNVNQNLTENFDVQLNDDYADKSSLSSNNLSDEFNLSKRSEQANTFCDNSFALKKVKATNQKQTSSKSKMVRPKKLIDIDSTSETFLVNGSVTSSSDEENDKFRLNSNYCINKENTTSDSDILKTPQKIINHFHNELSPSSSTPDSDIEQSVLNEENLKKSIMTILFGKDMTAEKVEESVEKIRDKSPASSSTSSECNKEKRYSFRIARQASVKQIAAIESKDEKLLKTANLTNKTKSTAR